MKTLDEITLGEALDKVLETENVEYEYADDLLDALTEAFWIMFKERYYEQKRVI